ncbi:MAG TPA: hypothetical protein VFD06_10305 [Candidatus Polarisedimenticolia bacterium]|nr:hypothetical protein [Candidatus Polarisedimenticolia bacterium]
MIPMPDSGGSGEVTKRREAPALLSLIDVVAATQDSVLPPGKRDSSGFWYPASCRNPTELFTPYQRSLQEKQRSVHRERRRRVASSRVRSSDPAPEQSPLGDRPVPMPLPCPEAPEP